MKEKIRSILAFLFGGFFILSIIANSKVKEVNQQMEPLRQREQFNREQEEKIKAFKEIQQQLQFKQEIEQKISDYFQLCIDNWVFYPVDNPNYRWFNIEYEGRKKCRDFYIEQLKVYVDDWTLSNDDYSFMLSSVSSAEANFPI